MDGLIVQQKLNEIKVGHFGKNIPRGGHDLKLIVVNHIVAAPQVFYTTIEYGHFFKMSPFVKAQ